MKSLSEICQLVKTEYVEGEAICTFFSVGGKHLGMCSALEELRETKKLSYEEKDKFMVEYRKFTNNRRVFYDRGGYKTSSKNQYGWNPKNRPARIKWLDQRI